ncbi:MAG: pilin [Patescibacteria group bacterium]
MSSNQITARIKKIFFLIIWCCCLSPLAVLASPKLTDPLQLGENDPLPVLANRFIQTALGISGVLALLAFIYGGILYMLAGVNPKNVEKGKELMKYAVIGLFIIFASYAIVNFLLSTVLQVPGSAA